MRNSQSNLTRLAISIVLTITLKFGLCIMVTIIKFVVAIDLGPLHYLGIVVLLALIPAVVLNLCWTGARISRPSAVMLYLVEFALACATALIYWMLLQRV